jgi:hypothetical protein
VPDDSTVVGVPGHIVFREGKRVVITDPKLINDPLSEALAAVASEVNRLAERVHQLEGTGGSEPLSESMQRIMEDIDYQIYQKTTFPAPAGQRPVHGSNFSASGAAA